MTADFARPIAAPPTISGVALLLGLCIGIVRRAPMAPLLVGIPLGLAIIGAGVWLIRLSMIEMDRGNTTYDPYAPSTHLVTSGIYDHIRNPGYLGLAVIHLGVAVLFNNAWIASTLPIAFLVTHFFVVLREEDKLRRTFGESYESYRSSTRRWI